MSESELDPIAEARRQWTQHWGPQATPAMGAITSIMRVEQILLARLNELLKPWELTFARYEALMLLYYSRAGALPLGKIGARLQVHPASVTNTIDGLERAGLVARVRHAQDGRMRLASLTDAGRVVAEEATAVLNRERFATAPLDDEALEVVFNALEPLRHAADRAAAAPLRRDPPAATLAQRNS